MVSIFKSKGSKSSSITKAMQVCEEVSKGNFEARITNLSEDGELGPLFNLINRIVDRTDAYIRESSAAMASASKKEFYRKINLKGLPGDYLNGAKLINSSIDSMALVSEETGKLAKLVTERLAYSTECVTEITEAASDSISKNDDASSKTFIVSETSKKSLQNIGAVSAATEELNASSHEITRQMEVSNDLVKKVLIQSEDAAEQIKALSEAAKQISSVIDMITDIASQTNLLALNATIEAARAGDAGKGFAVVASEVKNLAAQTTKATENIISQVDNIQTSTQVAVTSIEDIKKISVGLDDISSSISSAVSEQNSAQAEIAVQTKVLIDDGNDVLKTVTGVVQSAAVSYSSAIQVIWSCDDLKEPLSELNESMDSFAKMINT